MAAWTPTDLTSTSFVGTLSVADKSMALDTVTREIPSAQQRLAENTAALTAAETASNNGPQRRTINELKKTAADATLPQADRDAALAQATALTDLRDSLSLAAFNALTAWQRSTEYVDKLVSGQSNLITAGAVTSPPGPTIVQDSSTPAPDLKKPQNTDSVVSNATPATIPPTTIATPVDHGLPYLSLIHI